MSNELWGHCNECGFDVTHDEPNHVSSVVWSQGQAFVEVEQCKEPKEWTGELPQEVLELHNPYANSAYTHYRAVEKLSHEEALEGAYQAHRSHPVQ